MTYALVLKYNPCRDDSTGRFTFCTGWGAHRGADGEWIGHTGKKLPEKVLAKIKQYRVPPAWTDVQVNDSDTEALQVVGKDISGKTQYLYTKEHSANSAAEKFARLGDFHAAIPSIGRKVLNILNDDSESQLRRDSAAIVRLIEKTGFRRGSRAETSAKVKAYGASTLLKEHVSIEGDVLSFSFTGKKGVKQEHRIRDKFLADYLSRKGEGPLFNVGDTSLGDFFKSVAGDDFSLKDYRTWHGTRIATKELGKHDQPSTKKEALAIKKTVLTKVSRFLGNTPTVAMESYVDPTVWAPIDFYWKKAA